MQNNKIFELEPRKRIFYYILRNPGLHLRELSRKTKIPKTTLKYHLNFLIRQNLINVTSEGVYRRFYIPDKIGLKEKELLNLLRQDIPCKILLYFTIRLICSQIELSRELNKSPTTIEFHLKKLVDMDIITPVNIENGLIQRRQDSCYIVGRRPVRSEIIYRIKNADIELKLHKLIMKYGDSLPDQKTIAPLIKFVQENGIAKNLPNRINCHDVAMNIVCNILSGIFLHPYHV